MTETASTRLRLREYMLALEIQKRDIDRIRSTCAARRCAPTLTPWPPVLAGFKYATMPIIRALLRGGAVWQLVGLYPKVAGSNPPATTFSNPDRALGSVTEIHVAP